MKKIRMIALAVAMIAAIAILVLMQKTDKTEIETANVVVAAQDLSINTVITKDMVQVKSVPKDMILPGTYTVKDAVVGLIVDEDIYAGEQILQSRLTELGNRETASLSKLIEEGKRAITIAVTDVSGISNMIMPGDKVDVIGHYEEPVVEEAPAARDDEEEEEEEKTQFVSVTLVENIPVLAVDNVTSIHGKADGYTNITVLVTPEQANAIDWVSAQGLVRVVLRAPLDEEEAGNNKTIVEELVK